MSRLANRRNTCKFERASRPLRSGFEVEIGSARKIVRDCDKTQAGPCDSTVPRLTGESEVDPDADGVARVLAQARSRSVRRAARCRAAAGGAGGRPRVPGSHGTRFHRQGRSRRTVVAERLRDSASGTPSRMPSICRRFSVRRRRFASSPRAIPLVSFVGVAVPNRDALERAREALKPLPILSRPVVVAVAADAPGDAPDDRFVLPVDEAAAYDREAAREQTVLRSPDRGFVLPWPTTVIESRIDPRRAGPNRTSGVHASRPRSVAGTIRRRPSRRGAARDRAEGSAGAGDRMRDRSSVGAVRGR